MRKFIKNEKLKSVQAKKGQNVPKDVITSIKDCQEALKDYEKNKNLCKKICVLIENNIRCISLNSLKLYCNEVNSKILYD